MMISVTSIIHLNEHKGETEKKKKNTYTKVEQSGNNLVTKKSTLKEKRAIKMVK